MTTKRLTAKDYLNQWNELEKERLALSNKITERLIFLVKKYPNVPVDKINGTIILAKQVGSPEYTHWLNSKIRIKYIQVIEKFLADSHPHKQTTIDFDAAIINVDKNITK
jgi:hypothetical protein